MSAQQGLIIAGSLLASFIALYFFWKFLKNLRMSQGQMNGKIHPVTKDDDTDSEPVESAQHMNNEYNINYQKQIEKMRAPIPQQEQRRRSTVSDIKQIKKILKTEPNESQKTQKKLKPIQENEEINTMSQSARFIRVNIQEMSRQQQVTQNNSLYCTQHYFEKVQDYFDSCDKKSVLNFTGLLESLGNWEITRDDRIKIIRCVDQMQTKRINFFLKDGQIWCNFNQSYWTPVFTMDFYEMRHLLQNGELFTLQKKVDEDGDVIVYWNDMFLLQSKYPLNYEITFHQKHQQLSYNNELIAFITQGSIIPDIIVSIWFLIDNQVNQMLDKAMEDYDGWCRDFNYIYKNHSIMRENLARALEEKEQKELYQETQEDQDRQNTQQDNGLAQSQIIPNKSSISHNQDLRKINQQLNENTKKVNFYD